MAKILSGIKIGNKFILQKNDMKERESQRQLSVISERSISVPIFLPCWVFWIHSALRIPHSEIKGSALR